MNDLSASVLPYHLCLIKIEQDKLDRWRPLLVQLAIYSKCQFFSLTHCEGDVSLILDEHSLQQLPADLQSSWEVYSGIKVLEGPDVIDMCGIVSAVTAPLAQDHSIVYLSTFGTDIILVDKSEVDVVFPQVEAQIKQLKSTSLPETPPLVGQDNTGVLVSGISAPLRICMLPEANIEACAYSLVPLLLFPLPTNCNFFSITSITTSTTPTTPSSREITLVLHTSLLSAFPSGLLESNKYEWNALRITPGASPIPASNLVAPVSSRLARASMPVFFLSTFDDDLALVRRSDVVRAAAELLGHNIHTEL
eukprot:c7218_g1_i2.p1 GENE.c7218_g1_i2~~c7218_g1_i2.p1  ORF type:complete len:307 (-),score=85.48 c7218_g1_i2:200-1120(-)